MTKKVLLNTVKELQHGLAKNTADITACTSMSDGDCLYVIYSDESLCFRYDEDATDTATVITHPYVLAPDAGSGRWVEKMPSSLGAAMANASISLADDAEISLTVGKAGYGEAMIGDNQEHATFTFTSAGVVTLTINSANVVAADTDTNLCIYDAGTGVNIKNRLGSTLVLRYSVNYSTV